MQQTTRITICGTLACSLSMFGSACANDTSEPQRPSLEAASLEGVGAPGEEILAFDTNGTVTPLCGDGPVLPFYCSNNPSFAGLCTPQEACSEGQELHYTQLVVDDPNFAAWYRYIREYGLWIDNKSVQDKTQEERVFRPTMKITIVYQRRSVLEYPNASESDRFDWIVDELHLRDRGAESGRKPEVLPDDRLYVSPENSDVFIAYIPSHFFVRQKPFGDPPLEQVYQDAEGYWEKIALWYAVLTVADPNPDMASDPNVHFLMDDVQQTWVWSVHPRQYGEFGWTLGGPRYWTPP